QLGWRWLDDRLGSGDPTFKFASGAPVPGLMITFTPPTSSRGGQIDFTFDPLPPGTHLLSTQRLIFEGLEPLIPGETFLGKLDTHQSPIIAVPETTAVALAVAAALVAAMARRSFQRSAFSVSPRKNRASEFRLRASAAGR